MSAEAENKGKFLFTSESVGEGHPGKTTLPRYLLLFLLSHNT